MSSLKTMQNKVLDARILELRTAVHKLVCDLIECEPNIEQAVALGALQAVDVILFNLGPEKEDLLGGDANVPHI